MMKRGEQIVQSLEDSFTLFVTFAYFPPHPSRPCNESTLINRSTVTATLIKQNRINRLLVSKKLIVLGRKRFYILLIT